ncbi:MAG: glycerophosphodiester phosphodiesterase [Verrucomicrobiia bacterium]
MQRIGLLACAALLSWQTAFAEPLNVPAETVEQSTLRRQQVAERRQGVHVICHRGASEFAHENTLEAYQATFELGGDGNEIDVRSTKDGVLVCFHDDMLDRLLQGQGEVSELTWDELRQLPFRDPGAFGEHCRIPTLVEVLDLHQKHGGLLHLDIKRPGLDHAIAALLDRMEMWDHVAYCNSENSGQLLRDPRLKLLRYKAPGLYEDRSEVFPDAIASALSQPGDGLIVDDPRGVVVALGRKLGRVSKNPVAPPLTQARSNEPKLASEQELLRVLGDAGDWNQVANTKEEQAASGKRIRARAWAADMLSVRQTSSAEVFAALEERVRNRSLHKDWLYHGLDGAMALRTLILLQAPNATAAARFALWRDDSSVEPVVDRRWNHPRAWTDFRVKMVVFPSLEKSPGETTEKLCRDYLALSEKEAHRLAPPLFAEAAKTLLTVSPRTETALGLMQHRLRVVRGQVILICLNRAKEPWAHQTLEQAAPHALPYLVADNWRPTASVSMPLKVCWCGRRTWLLNSGPVRPDIAN